MNQDFLEDYNAKVRTQRAARARAQAEAAPLCGADALERPDLCRFVWHKRHPDAKGGPKRHVCGRRKPHEHPKPVQGGHRCHGCGLMKRAVARVRGGQGRL